MCFVLDVNCIPSFFATASKQHSEFAPLYNWLTENKGTCLVYGGKKYLKELSLMHRYMAMFTELKRINKIKIVNNKLVDTEEDRIKTLVDQVGCDDAHIIAIFCISGCRIFASKDKRADKFIKMRDLYPKGCKIPKIYRTSDHANLLCEDNIVAIRNIQKQEINISLDR